MLQSDTYFPCFPDPAEISTGPIDQEVLTGDTVELSCVAFGVPSPNITWSRPGVDDLTLAGDDRITVFMNGNDSRLTISNVQLSDADVYTCTAYNGVENVIDASEEASAIITVLGTAILCSTKVIIYYNFLSSTAVPIIEGPPDDQTVIVTLSTEFSCTAFGVPAPSVAWYLDDTQLMNDSVFRITYEVDGYYVTSYLMLVADLDYDGAIFTCFAENTVGSASADASLTVLCKNTLHV